MEMVFVREAGTRSSRYGPRRSARMCGPSWIAPAKIIVMRVAHNRITLLRSKALSYKHVIVES
jgi:hypothetical protein